MERFKSARQRLQAADSRLQVSEALAILIASLLPSELGMLPANARECLTADPERIPDCAFELTRTELTFRGPDEETTFLRELAHVFVLATNRLAAFDARDRVHNYKAP